VSNDVRNIWCCACNITVAARLTNGQEVYPPRRDLWNFPFWRCDACGNSVGCHHKTVDRTKPLGVIASPELKKARQHIHAILDPLWSGNKTKRHEIYHQMSKAMGISKYHTANLRTLEEARDAYRAALSLRNAV
jgi:zinc-finger-containing domain